MRGSSGQRNKKGNAMSLDRKTALLVLFGMAVGSMIVLLGGTLVQTTVWTRSLLTMVAFLLSLVAASGIRGLEAEPKGGSTRSLGGKTASAKNADNNVLLAASHLREKMDELIDLVKGTELEVKSIKQELHQFGSKATLKAPLSTPKNPTPSNRKRDNKLSRARGREESFNNDRGLPPAPLPQSLIAVWDNLKANGYFSASRLQQEIDALGISGKIIEGICEKDEVLGVELSGGEVHLLPNFGMTARAVSEWFDNIGTGTRKSLIQGLGRTAVGRCHGHNFKLEAKGQVD